LQLHLTSVSALPRERGNTEIASFHLNAACCSIKNIRNTLKHHLVTDEPPFTIKMIECVFSDINISPRWCSDAFEA